MEVNLRAVRQQIETILSALPSVLHDTHCPLRQGDALLHEGTVGTAAAQQEGPGFRWVFPPAPLDTHVNVNVKGTLCNVLSNLLPQINVFIHK